MRSTHKSSESASIYTEKVESGPPRLGSAGVPFDIAVEFIAALDPRAIPVTVGRLALMTDPRCRIAAIGIASEARRLGFDMAEPLLKLLRDSDKSVQAAAMTAWRSAQDEYWEIPQSELLDKLRAIAADQSALLRQSGDTFDEI